jgi:hypothetical protein
MAALGLSGGVRMTGIVASTAGGRLAITPLRSRALPLTVSRFPTIHRGGRSQALAEDRTDTMSEIPDAAEAPSTQEPTTSTRASYNDGLDSRSAPLVKASTLMQRELKKEGKRRSMRMRPHSGARGKHSVGHVGRERRAAASGGDEGEQAIDSDSERCVTPDGQFRCRGDRLCACGVQDCDAWDAIGHCLRCISPFLTCPRAEWQDAIKRQQQQ